MGVKGTFRSANGGGGVSLFVCSLYIEGTSICSLLLLQVRWIPGFHRVRFSDNRGKFSAKRGKSK